LCANPIPTFLTNFIVISDGIPPLEAMIFGMVNDEGNVGANNEGSHSFKAGG
jgi:hypothetical protein